MDAVREYFLSVCAAALICGTVTGLLQGKTVTAELVKLCAGLFLSLAVISPLAHIDFTGIEEFTLDHSSSAAQAAAFGENLASDALADIIKADCETYILDKAESLGVSITVEVTLSRDQIPVPVSVRISGDVSPYAKARLVSILTEEFGIPKEDQQWIG